MTVAIGSIVAAVFDPISWWCSAWDWSSRWVPPSKWKLNKHAFNGLPYFWPDLWFDPRSLLSEVPLCHWCTWGRERKSEGRSRCCSWPSSCELSSRGIARLLWCLAFRCSESDLCCLSNRRKSGWWLRSKCSSSWCRWRSKRWRRKLQKRRAHSSSWSLRTSSFRSFKGTQGWRTWCS